MKTLTSLLLIVPLFSILTLQTARGQTEDEFKQEFQQYAETHPQSEWEAYALARFAQMTTDVIRQEEAWSLIEQSFTTGPCLLVKQQLCDRDFEQRLLEITATTTAAAAVCAFTAAGNPIYFAVCAAAVAVQHASRLAAAQNAHRACYLRARLECLPPPSPTPSPNHCSILTPEKDGTNSSDEPASARDIVPLLADCSLYEDPCLCPPRSPIIVDLSGNGFDLTNMADGVMFNTTGFGLEPLGWTRANSDDAFLALDLNANGLIDNGLELFGNFTAQPDPAGGAERNGFEALAVFDLNGDRRIDSHDPVFSELRLWQDSNHNGVSEPEELLRLDKLELKTLFLDYRRLKRVDKHGNEFRYRARVNDLRDRQRGRWAWDVFLVSSRNVYIK
jgi:hypothetical protein